MKSLKSILGLSLYLGLFQVVFIVLLAIFSHYPKPNNEERDKSTEKNFYAMFMDVHSMMFIGFGFLMMFLKRYGFSSVGFNFVIAAYVLEWAILIRGWLEQSSDNSRFGISVENLIVADFCAAAVLISFGAVIGKVTLSQLIWMATVEVVVQSVNEFIGVSLLKAYDVGESMYVHVFGAYFGLAVAKVLNNKKVESSKESSNYNSDLFAMIGTILLWLYWPSFNSATAKEEGQQRAIVNTYLSIAASCITTFMVSRVVGKGKLNMVHVQNATLAGGVAVGTVADMMINPFGAAIIGSIAGIVSTLGFQYLSHLLKTYLKLHDTCGVNNLHGIPGLISGIVGAIVAATAQRDNYYGDKLYVFYPSRIPQFNSSDYFEFKLNESVEYEKGGLGRSATVQGGFQIAALFVTLGIALVSGILTGFTMKLPLFYQITDSDEFFEDAPAWIMEEGEADSPIDTSVLRSTNETELKQFSMPNFHTNSVVSF